MAQSTNVGQKPVQQSQKQTQEPQQKPLTLEQMDIRLKRVENMLFDQRGNKTEDLIHGEKATTNEDNEAVLGNAKDRNDSIYSNNPDYKWDDSSEKTEDHRWRRFKGHSGSKVTGLAELKKRMKRIAGNYKVEFVSQNSFYYFLRKIFLKNGINPEAEGKEFRKSITNSIADWCKEFKDYPGRP